MAGGITGTHIAGETGAIADFNAQDTAILGLQSRVESVNTVAASGAARTLPSVGTATLNDLTLTANCTITLPTATAGTSFLLLLRQDATGGRAVTWSGTVKWPGGAAPTLTAAASAVDMLSFICVAAGTWLGLPSAYDIR